MEAVIFDENWISECRKKQFLIERPISVPYETNALSFFHFFLNEYKDLSIEKYLHNTEISEKTIFTCLSDIVKIYIVFSLCRTKRIVHYEICPLMNNLKRKKDLTYQNKSIKERSETYWHIEDFFDMSEKEFITYASEKIDETEKAFCDREIHAPNIKKCLPKYREIKQGIKTKWNDNTIIEKNIFDSFHYNKNFYINIKRNLPKDFDEAFCGYSKEELSEYMNIRLIIDSTDIVGKRDCAIGTTEILKICSDNMGFMTYGDIGIDTKNGNIFIKGEKAKHSNKYAIGCILLYIILKRCIQKDTVVESPLDKYNGLFLEAKKVFGSKAKKFSGNKASEESQISAVRQFLKDNGSDYVLAQISKKGERQKVWNFQKDNDKLEDK